MALSKSDKNWAEKLLENKLVSASDSQEQKFEAKLTEFRDDFYTKIDPILKESLQVAKKGS